MLIKAKKVGGQMLAKDIMTKDVITVRPEEKVENAGADAAGQQNQRNSGGRRK